MASIATPKKKVAKKATSRNQSLAVEMYKNELIAQFLTKMEESGYLETLAKMKAKGMDVGIENIIFKTKSYDSFSIVESNRDKNRKQIEWWKKEISDNGKDLDIPFMMDSDLRVMDGQHRLAARAALELPVYFFISKNVTEADLAAIQQGKPWDVNGYLKHFVQQEKSGTKKGNTYTKYKKIYDRYNNKKLIQYKSIQHNELRMLITGHKAFSAATIHKPFNNGDLRFVISEKEVIDFLDWMLMDLPKKLSGKTVRNRYFQRAVVNLYSYENYERRIFEKMLTKKSVINELESKDFLDGKKVKHIVKALLEFYNTVAAKEGKKFKLVK